MAAKTTTRTKSAKPTAPSKMERYMGFLLQEWPKMAGHALTPVTLPPISRSMVLDATTTVVGDAPGLRLEFGVWRGNSIRACATKHPGQHWYGFDSFEGFPDDGRVDWQKPFKVIEMPDTPANVTLVKGYFSDTLDPFLSVTPGPVAFINVDCDIYSSTVDIFTALEKHGHIKAGLVIYFDELINYADYMWNESLALFEMLERTGLGLDWLCINQHLRSPDESVAHFHAGDHPTWNEDMHTGHWVQASCRLTELPIDCGPMQDADYRAKLAHMVAGFDKREAVRQEALNQRNVRLAEMDVLREERFRARKALEKLRLDERRAAQKRPAGG